MAPTLQQEGKFAPLTSTLREFILDFLIGFWVKAYFSHNRQLFLTRDWKLEGIFFTDNV
jgi:hypothetical protein